MRRIRKYRRIERLIRLVRTGTAKHLLRHGQLALIVEAIRKLRIDIPERHRAIRRLFRRPDRIAARILRRIHTVSDYLPRLQDPVCIRLTHIVSHAELQIFKRHRGGRHTRKMNRLHIRDPLGPRLVGKERRIERQIRDCDISSVQVGQRLLHRDAARLLLAVHDRYDRHSLAARLIGSICLHQRPRRFDLKEMRRRIEHIARRSLDLHELIHAKRQPVQCNLSVCIRRQLLLYCLPVKASADIRAGQHIFRQHTVLADIRLLLQHKRDTRDHLAALVSLIQNDRPVRNLILWLQHRVIRHIATVVRQIRDRHEQPLQLEHIPACGLHHQIQARLQPGKTADARRIRRRGNTRDLRILRIGCKLLRCIFRILRMVQIRHRDARTGKRPGTHIASGLIARHRIDGHLKRRRIFRKLQCDRSCLHRPHLRRKQP